MSPLLPVLLLELLERGLVVQCHAIRVGPPFLLLPAYPTPKKQDKAKRTK